MMSTVVECQLSIILIINITEYSLMKSRYFSRIFSSIHLNGMKYKSVVYMCVHIHNNNTQYKLYNHKTDPTFAIF